MEFSTPPVPCRQGLPRCWRSVSGSPMLPRMSSTGSPSAPPHSSPANPAVEDHGPAAAGPHRRRRAGPGDRQPAHRPPPQVDRTARAVRGRQELARRGQGPRPEDPSARRPGAHHRPGPRSAGRRREDNEITGCLTPCRADGRPVDQAGRRIPEKLSAVRVIAPPSRAVLAHEALGWTSIPGNAESADRGAGVSKLDAHLPVGVLAARPAVVIYPGFFLFFCL